MFAVVKGWQTFACGVAIMLSRHDALHITARQLREFALLAQPAGFLSRLLAGNGPGGKPVWLSFCNHGRELFEHYEYRGTHLINK